jgi:hypothetical protein
MVRAIAPSIMHTYQGGFKDTAQNYHEEWFAEQISPGTPLVLSLMERRWLYEKFRDMNVIDGRFIQLDTEQRIGTGSFGYVGKYYYQAPGTTGTTDLIQQR